MKFIERLYQRNSYTPFIYNSLARRAEIKNYEIRFMNELIGKNSDAGFLILDAELDSFTQYLASSIIQYSWAECLA